MQGNAHYSSVPLLLQHWTNLSVGVCESVLVTWPRLALVIYFYMIITLVLVGYHTDGKVTIATDSLVTLPLMDKQVSLIWWLVASTASVRMIHKSSVA